MKEIFETIGTGIKDILGFFADNILPISVLTAVVAWSAILLPPRIARAIQISDFLDSNAQWSGLLAFIASTLSIALLLYEFFKWMFELLKRRRLLADLTPIECERLKVFIDARTSAVPFSLYDGVPFSLVDKGILRKADSLPNHRNEQDFVIRSWAYKTLMENPEILDKCRNS